MERNSHAGKNRPSAFGELLRRYRRERDWTQEKLAEEVEVSRETISHLETGKITMPEWAQLRRIVHTLKIPGSILLRSLDLMIDENESWLGSLDDRSGGKPEGRKGRVDGRRSWYRDDRSARHDSNDLSSTGISGSTSKPSSPYKV